MTERAAHCDKSPWTRPIYESIFLHPAGKKGRRTKCNTFFPNKREKKPHEFIYSNCKIGCECDFAKCLKWKCSGGVHRESSGRVSVSLWTLYRSGHGGFLHMFSPAPAEDGYLFLLPRLTNCPKLGSNHKTFCMRDNCIHYFSSTTPTNTKD